LISQASVSCFCVSVALPFMTRKGTLYIVSFRSRQIQRDEDWRHQSNKVATGRPHMSQASGHMGHACFLLGPPLLHFLLSKVLFHVAPAKFQVIWTTFGSLKVKNIEKEVFWFSQVNQIKLGNMWIIPNNHQKAWI
jgi:hypothetical protein